MKGQVRFSFIISVVIFCILLFYIFSQTNSLFTAIVTDAKNDASKAIAYNALTVLLEDKGSPENWNLLTQEPKRIGLVLNKPYEISKQKVLKLASNCSLLDSFELDQYSLTIDNSTRRILTCGSNLLESPTVIYTRYIYIDNGVGEVVLKRW